MASATTTRTTASGSEVSEGPVLTVITNRLRALRKRQESLAPTDEPQRVFRSDFCVSAAIKELKTATSAQIEELEYLRQPLSAAVSDEVSLATSHLSSAAAPNGAAVGECKSEVDELLQLLYFGSIFDVKSQSNERGYCISYDHTGLLVGKDLDSISSLSQLLISRPVDSSLSHQNALQRCIEHAKLWLANSDQPIEPNSTATYASLRNKLSRIMSSAYFIITPGIRAPKEIPAAAGGNFIPFQDEEAPSHDQGLEIVENQPGSTLDAFKKFTEINELNHKSMADACLCARECGKNGLQNEVVELLILELRSCPAERKIKLLWLVNHILHASRFASDWERTTYLPAFQDALQRILDADDDEEYRKICKRFFRDWEIQGVFPSSCLRPFIPEIPNVLPPRSSKYSCERKMVVSSRVGKRTRTTPAVGLTCATDGMCPSPSAVKGHIATSSSSLRAGCFDSPPLPPPPPLSGQKRKRGPSTSKMEKAQSKAVSKSRRN